MTTQSKEETEISFKKIVNLLSAAGCKNIYVKKLASNDNSKNQIYFGASFEALNIFPNKGVFVDNSGSEKKFKAMLDFSWINKEGKIYAAPETKLILYPQYPEVRMSGMLKHCQEAPSHLIARRTADRLLFMGIREDGKILGYAVHPESQAAKELATARILFITNVFSEIPVREGNSQELLVREMKRIYLKGWIDSKRLNINGEITDCNAPNCGGYTLEAELGIIPNGNAEPDFKGWEIKQYNVKNFDSIFSGVLTLMTPEPTKGYYTDAGVAAFIKKFGYPDQLGRTDRLNFGGVHVLGATHNRTGLTLTLNGYDTNSSKITDPSGGLSLISNTGEEAATWEYTSLMKHWNRKHALAAYVPSKIIKTNAGLQYHYGPKIRLGKGTDFLLFLKAVANKNIYYDPGIKMENVSSHPKIKRRSQFRIKSKDLSCIYHNMEAVSLV